MEARQRTWLFVAPDARPSSKQVGSRGKETRPPKSFYGNGGMKFPKPTMGDGSGLVALFCTLRVLFKSRG